MDLTEKKSVMLKPYVKSEKNNLETSAADSCLMLASRMGQTSAMPLSSL
jgi:hypothetical protein